MARETAVRDDEHAVLFYDSDMALVVDVTDYITSALLAGDAVLVVATAHHRASFLASIPGDLRRTAEGKDRLTFLDARVAMSHFLRDGTPDPGLFDHYLGGLIRAHASQGTRVTVYGEMVAVLWKERHVVEALRLEELWNELQQRLGFSLYCAYPREADLREGEEGFARVCMQHDSVQIGKNASSGAARVNRAATARRTT